MRLESRAHLADVQRSLGLLQQFTVGKSLEAYRGDALLRSAVERQLEIIGESLNRLAREDPATASRIQEYRKIISFRNVLIHGYDAVDDEVVWGVLESKLPVLTRDVARLLQEEEAAGGPRFSE